MCAGMQEGIGGARGAQEHPRPAGPSGRGCSGAAGARSRAAEDGCSAGDAEFRCCNAGGSQVSGLLGMAHCLWMQSFWLECFVELLGCWV